MGMCIGLSTAGVCVKALNILGPFGIWVCEPIWNLIILTHKVATVGTLCMLSWSTVPALMPSSCLPLMTHITEMTGLMHMSSLCSRLTSREALPYRGRLLGVWTPKPTLGSSDQRIF